MKRFMIYCLVVAFIAAIPLSHSLMAKKPAKVQICHVNSANDVEGLSPFVFGRVIEVSSNALKAHMKHGDCSDPDMYMVLTEAKRDLMEVEYGIKLPNANCYFEVFWAVP